MLWTNPIFWLGGLGFSILTAIIAGGYPADPSLSSDFNYNEVSHDYGKTVGWEFLDGRDFSRKFASDSNGLVINETAMQFMGLKNSVGEDLMWFDEHVRIIGVIKDMVVNSPYEPVRPLIYNLAREQGGFINIRINPTIGADAALAKIETVFKKYDPAVPFQYNFVDQDYAAKFFDELRIAKLSDKELTF